MTDPEPERGAWTVASTTRAWDGRAGLWVTSRNRAPMYIESIDAPSPGARGKTLAGPRVVHVQSASRPAGSLTAKGEGPS